MYNNSCYIVQCLLFNKIHVCGKCNNNVIISHKNKELLFCKILKLVFSSYNINFRIFFIYIILLNVFLFIIMIFLIVDYCLFVFDLYKLIILRLTN